MRSAPRSGPGGGSRLRPNPRYSRRRRDGLSFDPISGSLFSDPDHRFGVYLANSLAAAVAETIVRDRKNGNPGQTMLSHDDVIAPRRAVEVSSRENLTVLNLTLPLGAPHRGSHHLSEGGVQTTCTKRG